MLELMIDGTDTQLALQRAKDTLDLRQLHIARPQHRRIFGGEIAAQQIMAVALLGSFQLDLVDLKRGLCARICKTPRLHWVFSICAVRPDQDLTASEVARRQCSRAFGTL